MVVIIDKAKRTLYEISVPESVPEDWEESPFFHQLPSDFVSRWLELSKELTEMEETLEKLYNEKYSNMISGMLHKNRKED